MKNLSDNIKNTNYNDMEDFTVKKLLIEAKRNDALAKEEIIKRYYPLIIKEAKSVFVKNYTFDDLIQIGIISLLNAIEKFDSSKSSAYFTSYVNLSIKNGFRYLCRGQIRYNNELSLNNTNEEGFEIIDSIIDERINIENFVIDNIINKSLSVAINNLDYEERNLIEFLYLENIKPNLSKYAMLNGKDYYYCTCLKRRALKKLKNAFIEILD